MSPTTRGSDSRSLKTGMITDTVKRLPRRGSAASRRTARPPEDQDPRDDRPSVSLSFGTRIARAEAIRGWRK